MMRFSLRNRLRFGLAAIAIAIALLAAAAVLSLTRLGGAVEAILRENYASVIACEQMKEAIERQDSAALFASSGREDIAVPLLLANRRGFEEAFATEAANVTLPAEGPLVREIEADYRAYTAAVDRVLALPREARAPAYFAELFPLFSRIKDRVQAVLRLNHEHMVLTDRRTRDLAQGSVQAALAVGALAVLFAVWFAWWLPRVIVGPIEQLTRAARLIGEGDLAVKVDDVKIDELAPLAAAFTMMLERLRAYRDSSLGELLAAKDLARSTLSCMLDPVVVLARGGAVLLANEAAEAAFRIEAGTAEEVRASGATLPGEIQEARDQVLATGEPVLPRSLSEAMRWRAPDGERYYLVRAAPLRAAPGEEPSAIVVAQDVTRFHRIDELKSDMVATVSHEFKTPLTSLRMATHLLLEPAAGTLTEAQRELVTTARDDTERLRAMVEDLLDVVRIESEAGALRRVPIEPVGLLCEVADAHRIVAQEKGVAIVVAPGPPPGLAAVDPERLSIALANLVSNAVRHTPAGGKVTLAAERDDGALQITVSDTGEGIDSADLAQIFDRTASARSGAESRARHGLGLAIAREILLQHGGELRAASRRGEGSVFTLVVPLDGGRG